MGKSNLEIAITALNNATAEIDKLQSSLKQTTTAQDAHNKVSKEGQDTQKKFGGAINATVQELTGFNVTTLAGVGGVALLAKTMKQSITDWIDYNHQMELGSQATGMQVTEYSRLVQAGDDVRVSQDAIKNSMALATKNGFLPSIDNLAKLADELQGMASATDRAEKMNSIFGRGWKEINPLLAEGGARFRELIVAQGDGLLVTEKSIQETNQLYAETDALNDEVTSLKNTFASGAVPVLLDYLEATKAIHGPVTNWEEALKRLGPVQLVTIANAYEQAKATREARESAIGVTEAGFIQAKMLSNDLTPALVNADTMYSTMPGHLQNYINELNNSRNASAELARITRDELNLNMQEYNKQLLFKIASEGLSAQAAAALALQMGLVNEKTKYAADRTAELKEELSKGEITVEEYTRLINGMANGLDRIQSKKVNIDIYINEHGRSAYYGGAQDDTGEYKPADAYAQPFVPLQQEPTKKKSGGAQAIGGWYGPGTYLRGEMGPELTKETGFGQTINNYEMNYNLTAHYPKYQDEHAARNDLIAMTMLKNQGAAKWAS